MTRLTALMRLGLTLCALTALVGGTAFRPTGQGEVRLTITQVDQSQFPRLTVYLSVTTLACEWLAVAASRLSLTENGRPVTIESVSGEGEIGPLTTLLVMDVSGSMNRAGKLATAQAAARAYVEQMRPGDQAGLLTFNTQVDYVQAVTTDRAALAAAIDGLRANDDTAMFDALARGTDILSGVAGRKAIIVLTDGLDNRSRASADTVIALIGPSGLSISTIGLGDPSQLGVTIAGLDETGLRSLAERGGGSYGYANDPQALRALYEQFGRTMQSEYAVTYTSALALRDGVNRSLAVQLGDGGAAAQSSYNPGGVVPEVAGRATGGIFLAILAGLAALLFAPVLLRRGWSLAQNAPGNWYKLRSRMRYQLRNKPQKKKPARVRLRDDSQPPAQPRIRLR